MKYTYTELEGLENYGLAKAVDLTWHKKDRGQPWLVIERGDVFDFSTGRTMYSDTGRLIATSRSYLGANNRAGKARVRLRRLHLSGRIDVIRRKAVEVLCSGGAYGCISGTGSAA